MLGLRLTKKQKPGECRSKKCKERATWRFRNGDLCDIHLAIHKATTNGDYITPERIRPMASTITSDAGTILRSDLHEQQTELQETTAELEEALGMVKEYMIEGKSDLDFAADSLADVKGQWLALEKRRKAATQPINKSLKEINSWFKAPQTALKKIEGAWKIKIATSAEDARAEQERLLEKAQEYHDQGDPDGTRCAILAAADAPLEPTEGISFRELWKFEVLDASKVPREFTTPDLVKIGDHIKAHKGDTEIPGIRVYKNLSVSSRSK